MLKTAKLINKFTIVRKFHISTVFNIDQDWRRKMKLPVNPNKESPLTYLPDFTYIDGRPSALGKNQKKRLIKQRELSTKIVDGLNEINFALERFKQLSVKSELEKRRILDSKLKMKGFKMFKN
ncbi:hypothetical protein ACKWTF_004268 [Chironomus riparius]